MESVGSNSPESSPPPPPPLPPPPPDNYRPRHRLRSPQAIADRIVRALHHHLRLLHRSECFFYVLGATGNVYKVTLSILPSCTCPDRTTPCKHILFVYIRVLGVPLDDGCLKRRTLRPCRLSRLLGTPTLPGALAGPRVRERFHQLFLQTREDTSRPVVEIAEGTSCPVCLDEIEKEDKVVTCGTCRNPIHEECLLRWKRSRGRRSASCVICRARWRDRMDQENYLNLAAYVGRDDMAESSGGSLCGG